MRVFVDVAELAPDAEGRTVRVRWTWRKTWRESSEAASAARETHQELDVVLVSDADVLLEPRASSPSRAARGE